LNWNNSTPSCGTLPIVKPVARFAYITGWRANSEILPLQWRQVDFQAGMDFQAGTVQLDPETAKNMEGRVFPMTRDLREGALSPWVFTYDGKRFKSCNRAWVTACKAVGVPGRLAHDVRRTAVRSLVRAGIPETSHDADDRPQDTIGFERYNIVSQSDLFDAARLLDQLTGTISGTIRDQAVNEHSEVLKELG